MKLPLSGAIAVALFVASASGRAEEPDQRAEVVVHEQRRPPISRRDPTAASTVIDRDALTQPGADAADVVARAPGVQTTRSGSGADLATASIRGATSAQTPVYLAGIRLNDDVTGTADLSTVPIWMLDRIEIFRGNAPEQADRLGIGGAIFFEPRLPKDVRVGAGAELGSFGRFANWVGAGAASQGQGALVALRRERSDENYQYVDDNGTRFDPSDDRVVTRPNADYTRYDLLSIGRFELGSRGGQATLIADQFAREQGVTGIGVLPAQHARAKTSRLLSGISTKLPCGSRDSGCELEIVTSELVARSEIDDPFNELHANPGTTASKGERTTSSVRLKHALGERAQIGVGFGEELERLSIDLPTGPGARARRSVTRLHAMALAEIVERLDLLTLGAIACDMTSGATGYDGCRELEPEARIGARYRAAERFELLANLSRTVRIPTLGELYGISPLVRGNPQLVAEAGIGADAGARASFGSRAASGFVDGFVFARRVTDLIGYTRSSFGWVRPYNVAAARLVGAELAAGADLLEHVRSELALTLLDPRDVSNTRLGNDILPYQSRLVAMVYGELYGGLSHGLLDRLALGARVRERSSRYADAAGLVVIDEEWIVDLEGRLSAWKGRAQLRVSVENLFDTAHFDLIGFPQPGRRLSAGVELWWF